MAIPAINPRLFTSASPDTFKSILAVLLGLMLKFPSLLGIYN